MKKINFLAKILFLFFAIASFSLLIVSCNDDDEEKKYCDDCSTEIVGYFSIPQTFLPEHACRLSEYGVLTKESEGFLLTFKESVAETQDTIIWVDSYLLICNPSKLSKDLQRKASTKNGVKVEVSGNVRATIGEYDTNSCILEGYYFLEVSTINEYIK